MRAEQEGFQRVSKQALRDGAGKPSRGLQGNWAGLGRGRGSWDLCQAAGVRAVPSIRVCPQALPLVGFHFQKVGKKPELTLVWEEETPKQEAAHQVTPPPGQALGWGGAELGRWCGYRLRVHAGASGAFSRRWQRALDANPTAPAVMLWEGPDRTLVSQPVGNRCCC